MCFVNVCKCAKDQLWVDVSLKTGRIWIRIFSFLYFMFKIYHLWMIKKVPEIQDFCAWKCHVERCDKLVYRTQSDTKSHERSSRTRRSLRSYYCGLVEWARWERANRPRTRPHRLDHGTVWMFFRIWDYLRTWEETEQARGGFVVVDRASTRLYTSPLC